MSQRAIALLLAVASGLAAIALELTGLTAPVELAFFDRRLALRPDSPWPDDLLLVTVDDRLANEAWPIPARTFNRLIDALRDGGAKTIAVDFTMERVSVEDPDGSVRTMAGTVLPVFPSRLGDSPRVMGLTSALVPILLSPHAELSPDRLGLPAAPFANGAGALGHTVFVRGRDDRVRGQVPLLGIRGAGGSVPSLALAALARHRGIDLRASRFAGGTLSVPGLPPARVYGGEVLLDLRPGEPPPPRVDASAILAGTPEPRLRDALVIVYNGASNMPDVLPTAASARTPGGLVHAFAVRALAGGRTPRLFPPWLALLVVGVVVLFAAPVLARNRAPRVLAIGGMAISVWALFAIALVPLADLFLPLTAPLIFLAATAVLLSTWAGERSAERLRTAPGSGDARTAPRGRVAIVFTDVQGSTSIWEAAPGAMRDALVVHDNVLREVLRGHRGYEVKTDGDAFMIAFASSVDAVAFCLRAQEKLLEAPWPAALLRQPHATAEGEPLRFRGLRVRMGVDVGEPDAKPDTLTGRMDYFGSPVNRAARVSSAAHGGQTLVTMDVWKDVKGSLPTLGIPEVLELPGHYALRGFEQPEKLVQLLPAKVASRIFASPRVERTTRG